MKTLQKTIVILVMFILPGMALASMSNPSDMDDTIRADIRQPNYYYTKWFDECSNFFPNGGVVDSCFCRYPEIHNFYGSPIAKWEHASHRMKVSGLVAMVDRYTPPDAVDSALKLPEYLYLYHLVGRHYALLQNYGIEDGLDLVLVDSVRWDTATAKVMELRRGWNGEHNQYCYLYEAYFENPVYVDSDFYIIGSTNSNVLVSPGSAYYMYTPTVYTDIMDFGGYSLMDGCDQDKYMQYITTDCKPQGGWVAIYDRYTSLGWYTPWPDSPWGYYLPIVDQWNLNAVPNDTSYGEVLGGGYYPDSTFATIEAVPALGYAFDTWNDGVTDNPRVVQVTSDTSFVAIFYSEGMYNLSLFTFDETQGTVVGSGNYLYGSDVSITAVPYNGYKFSHWNDGVTDNPRVVHLVSDTAFVAHFAEKEYYTVQTATNNNEWGSVEGGGVYMEGEEAMLTVSTEPFCLFEGWSDGDWSLPRTVTVTQDTLFTALFSFDSAWAAGIETAGTLDFTVSPNPTTGHLTVTMPKAEACEVAVLDLRGKALMHKKSVETTLDIDLGALPSGQYLLLVRSDGRQGIRKVVKK